MEEKALPMSVAHINSYPNLHPFPSFDCPVGGDAGDAFVLMCGDGGNDVGALKQVREARPGPTHTHTSPRDASTLSSHTLEIYFTAFYPV